MNYLPVLNGQALHKYQNLHVVCGGNIIMANLINKVKKEEFL